MFFFFFLVLKMMLFLANWFINNENFKYIGWLNEKNIEVFKTDLIQQIWNYFGHPVVRIENCIQIFFQNLSIEMRTKSKFPIQVIWSYCINQIETFFGSPTIQLMTSNDYRYFHILWWSNMELYFLFDITKFISFFNQSFMNHH